MAEKILILGSSGMLGHDLVQAFSDRNVVAWSAKDLDITNEQQVKEKILALKPTVVINAAGFTDVDGAEKNEVDAMKLNGEGPGFVAKACHILSIPLVHYSTEYIFDGKDPKGYDEHAKTRPLNIYGHSKLAGEVLMQSNHNKYYLIRTSWLYGHAPQRGKPRGLNFVDIMLNLAKAGKDINVVDDQIGKPTFTKDLAEKTKAILDQEAPFGIYHVVNEGTCSWYDFAKKIFEIKGLTINLKPIKSADYPLPTPRPQYSILLNTKLLPLRSWEEALKEYLS